MKQNYSFIIDKQLVSLDITHVENCGMNGIYINRLFVPNKVRGNGYGSAALWCLCKDADAQGVNLYLHVNPYYQPDYLNADKKLKDLYTKFGFKGQMSGLWIRLPNQVELPAIF